MKTEKSVTKMCVVCGKIFTTTVKNKKCCSKRCEADERSTGGQLCWSCQNATGKCSWSAGFIPVDGWIALPRIVRNYDNITRKYEETHTYRIKFCPQYMKDASRRGCNGKL